MRIENFKLKHYRLFKDLEYSFSDQNLIVLLGENGTGKSTILDAFASCLVHFTGKLFSDSDVKWNVNRWSDRSDITVDANSFDIQLSIAGKPSFRINLHKEIDQNGYDAKVLPQTIIKKLRTDIKNKEIKSLPLLVYYDTYRTKTGENNNNDKKSPFYAAILEGYRNAFDVNVSSFNQFEEWYINQENIENERKIDKNDTNYSLPKLEIIRKAIKSYLKELHIESFGRIRGKREDYGFNELNGQVKNRVFIEKEGTLIQLSKLSEGERMMVLIVADIARRLSILNKSVEESIKGEGIVLIDEIDMHLHPLWQRKIIPALIKTFPNLQFIITTHSPQVVSSVSSNFIYVLKDKNLLQVARKTHKIDSNTLLKDVFKTPYNSDDILKIVNKIDNAIDSQENPDKIKKLIDKVREIVNQDPGEGSNQILSDLEIQLAAYKYELNHDSN